MDIFNRKQSVFLEKKGFFDKKNKKSAAIFLIICLFLLNLSFFSSRIRNFFYSVTEPLQEWFWQKGSFAREIFDWVFELSEQKKENEALKKENAELIAKAIEIENLERENAILRTAIGLGLEKDFDLILCNVLAKDNDYLTISKGSLDGIESGFPVITQDKALVGKVVYVYDHVSKVQLLSSKDSSFDVEILGKDVFGLAKGKGGLELSLEFIPKEEDIVSQDKVITAVLGGNFPASLLVGQVVKIEKKDTSSFQEILVRSAFDINDVLQLFVIKDFNL